MKNIKKIGVIALSITFFVATFGFASAQTTNDALIQQIQNLLQQVKTLQDQIAKMDTERGTLQTQLQESLKLTRTLSLGMSNDDVKLLQEILATDPEIYPEGLITGYFGSLTEKAVKRFQAKFGIEQVGNVGPKTISHLNKLLTEGAGKSGKVPPGLLIAPGIAKKIDTSGFAPLPGQKLPPGIAKKIDGTPKPTQPTTDITPPTISDLSVSSITATTSKITFRTNELSTSTLWYSSTTPITSTFYLVKTNNFWGTNHEYNLDNLSTSTNYHYKIEVSDFSKNKATTTEQSFKTADE